ncbi:hypothetical protein ACRAKI_21670 [Saccharothrix isguenensis]
MIEVWRNDPAEAMHASRRGPSDAAMFAESRTLYDHAAVALTAAEQKFGPLDFEQQLLERDRLGRVPVVGCCGMLAEAPLRQGPHECFVRAVRACVRQ